MVLAYLQSKNILSVPTSPPLVLCKPQVRLCSFCPTASWNWLPWTVQRRDSQLSRWVQPGPSCLRSGLPCATISSTCTSSSASSTLVRTKTITKCGTHPWTSRRIFLRTICPRVPPRWRTCSCGFTSHFAQNIRSVSLVVVFSDVWSTHHDTLRWEICRARLLRHASFGFVSFLGGLQTCCEYSRTFATESCHVYMLSEPSASSLVSWVQWTPNLSTSTTRTSLLWLVPRFLLGSHMLHTTRLDFGDIARCTRDLRLAILWIWTCGTGTVRISSGSFLPHEKLLLRFCFVPKEISAAFFQR